MTVQDATRHPELSTEDDRVETRPVLIILFVTLGLVIAFSFVAGALLASREGALRSERGFPERELEQAGEVSQVERTLLEPASPRRADVHQRRELGTYTWVDRERGIVDIPIERAMDLLVLRSQVGTPR